MNKTDIGDLPVMKRHCKSCPFKPNKHGIWQNVELANKVIGRTLFKAQQVCHTTEGKNREPKNRCKGAFDYADEVYKRLFGIGFEEWKKGQK